MFHGVAAVFLSQFDAVFLFGDFGQALLENLDIIVVFLILQEHGGVFFRLSECLSIEDVESRQTVFQFCFFLFERPDVQEHDLRLGRGLAILGFRDGTFFREDDTLSAIELPDFFDLLSDGFQFRISDVETLGDEFLFLIDEGPVGLTGTPRSDFDRQLPLKRLNQPPDELDTSGGFLASDRVFERLNFRSHLGHFGLGRRGGPDRSWSTSRVRRSSDRRSIPELREGFSRRGGSIPGIDPVAWSSRQFYDTATSPPLRQTSLNFVGGLAAGGFQIVAIGIDDALNDFRTVSFFRTEVSQFEHVIPERSCPARRRAFRKSMISGRNGCPLDRGEFVELAVFDGRVDDQGAQN